MPVNKSTLRALIGLELIDSGEEKEEESNEPEKNKKLDQKKRKTRMLRKHCARTTNERNRWI